MNKLEKKNRLAKVIDELAVLGVDTIAKWDEAQDEEFDNVDFFQTHVDNDDEMFDLMDEVEEYLARS